jgi:ABC-type proline/glycine betaine transport system substrate-binding protein
MTSVITIPDLNNTDLTQILGIEPGAVISERIPGSVIPTYDLNQAYVPSSTAGMLYRGRASLQSWAGVRLRPLAAALDERKVRLQVPRGPAGRPGRPERRGTISSIVNKDLPDEDPVAYAFMENLKLTEEQVNEIENINPQDYGEAARTWLEDENNRNSLQPAIDAAREAQES